MSRIVLVGFGSLGDLHPTIAIALELKARGHAVTVATHEMYRFKIRRERLGFHPLAPDFATLGDLNQVFERAMNGWRGTEYVLRQMVLPFVRAQFDDLMAAARGADLLVAHPLSYAAPVVAEVLGIPWASTSLQPVTMFSALDPCVFSNAPWLEPWFRRSPALSRAFLGFARRHSRAWMAPIDRLRKGAGLPPATAHPGIDGMVSPHAHLALFSRELAEPQVDWPASSIQTGFAFYDKDDDGTTMPEGLEAFLAVGPPPIVFTLGSSAVMAAGRFYAESAEAARRLGRRAVLLIGHDPRNRPESALPEGVVAFEYAAYSELFPRAAAIVHQGGAGTTAQAMRAGRPMVVVPFAHDQPDHAARIARRGLGVTLPRHRYWADRAHDALRRVLADPGMARRAEAVGRRVRAENGAKAAADALEAQIRGS